ncbi:MAG: Zn-dependent exopeptidase M28 [Ruminococcaceae bacterium]|nr:Zn-dependent exopeptidase M28 [Oscillospiraceae bacterium]
MTGGYAVKANESVQNYPSRLREMSNYAAREVKKVCTEIGPRESGEESERKAQAYVAESMKNFCDSVETEEFDVHPKAFMSWVPIDVVLTLLSIACIILKKFGVFGETAGLYLNIAAAAFCFIGLFLMIMEFLFYKQLLDPLFPKRTTCNVLCTRKPSGEAKRRIIFSGHVDSAYEWYYTHLGGGALLKLVIITSIGSMILNFVFDIASFFALPKAVDTGILIAAFVTAVPIIAAAFFVNWKLVVPGANDNLTGVFASMAVIRFMEHNNIRFENTEVVAVSTACEEAGLRGAKAFAKKHAKDDIETVVIAVDTLRDFDYMGVYNKDMTGTVKLDGSVAAMVKKASEIAGLDLPYANVYFGSSDAAAMAQGGLRSAALCAMDPAPARYYHTREDTPDNLDLKTIEAGINVMLETAFLYDTEGLKESY